MSKRTIVGVTIFAIFFAALTLAFYSPALGLPSWAPDVLLLVGGMSLTAVFSILGGLARRKDNIDQPG